MNQLVQAAAMTSTLTLSIDALERVGRPSGELETIGRREDSWFRQEPVGHPLVERGTLDPLTWARTAT